MKKIFTLIIFILVSSSFYLSGTDDKYISPISKYRNKIVNAIIFEPNNISEDKDFANYLMSLIEITPKYDILTPISIARSLQSLYKTGYFKKIHVRARESFDGVALIFYFEKFKTIKSIEIINLPKTLKRDVMNLLTLKKGKPLNEVEINSNIERIIQFLKQTGYEDSKAQYEIIEAEENSARVKINLILGKPSIIDGIEYVYIKPIEPTLKKSIEKILKVRAGGPLNMEDLNSRIRGAISILAAKGYIGSKISYKLNKIGDNNVKLLIECDVGVKPIIRILGYRISRKRLEELVPIKKEQYISEALLEDYARNISDYINMNGYWQTRVKFSYDENNSIITFYINKGVKYKKVLVFWEGNSHIKDAELNKLNLFKNGYIEGLANAELKRVELFYNDYGYRYAKATIGKIELMQNKFLKVLIRIEENERAMIEKINVFGLNSLSEEYLRQKMSIYNNGYFSLRQLEEDIKWLKNEYINLGYASADVSYNILDGDSKNNVIININIDEGGKYYVDRIFIHGNYSTKASFIKKYLDIKPDDAFSYDKLLSSQKKLYELEVFDKIDFKYPPFIKQGSSHIDLTLDLEESYPYSLNYGIGYQQEDKIRAFISLTRKNLFGRGIRGELLLRYGFIEKRFFCSLEQPSFFNLPIHSLLTGTYEHQTRESFSYDGRIITFQLNLPIAKNTNFLIEYRYNNTDLEMKKEISEIIIEPTYRTVSASSVAGIFIQDKRDNLFEPKDGYFYSASLEYASKVLKSEQEFLKFYTQFYYYYDVFNLFIIAVSSRLGMIESFREDGFLPINFRFFAGGSKTFRGAPLDKLGPIFEGVPLGGKGLFINNLEFRIPIYGNFSIVAFYDVGNVFRKVGYIVNGSDYRHAVGIGFRYSTPIGPIAFDIGHLLKAKPDEKRYLYFLSIGHTF
jgi:outer membrane protein assembly factor BamA